jgi:hypothetical protein
MFLKRWRDIGGHVYADLNATFGHIGPHPFPSRPYFQAAHRGTFSSSAPYPSSSAVRDTSLSTNATTAEVHGEEVPLVTEGEGAGIEVAVGSGLEREPAAAAAARPSADAAKEL